MKKFIYIDMDCFYVVVEMCDNFVFVNVLLVIGGNSCCGVLLIVNYIVCKYGVCLVMLNYYVK